MKKIFLLLFTSLQLSAFNWSLSTEAAIYFSKFDGDIKNSTSDVKYRDDLQYDKAVLSYFETELRTSKWYIPTFNVNYMNIIDRENADFNATKHMIRKDFDTNLTTDTAYKVVNFEIFKSFFKKGDRVRTARKKFYPGDFEFDLGLNVKYMNYRINAVNNMNDENATMSFIEVKQFVPLPYAGVKYYYYNFVFFANISTLGFSNAKASNYKYGVEYRIFGRIYTGVSYMNESFEAVEKDDKVTFSSSGTKFSVKYIF